MCVLRKLQLSSHSPSRTSRSSCCDLIPAPSPHATNLSAVSNSNRPCPGSSGIPMKSLSHPQLSKAVWLRKLFQAKQTARWPNSRTHPPHQWSTSLSSFILWHSNSIRNKAKRWKASLSFILILILTPRSLAFGFCLLRNPINFNCKTKKKERRTGRGARRNLYFPFNFHQMIEISALAFSPRRITEKPLPRTP